MKTKAILALACAFALSILFSAAALADRLIEENHTSTLDVYVYETDDGEQYIIRREGPGKCWKWRVPVGDGDEVYHAWFMGYNDCVTAYAVGRLSNSGAHVTQIGDEDSCVLTSTEEVDSVYIQTGYCRRIAAHAFEPDEDGWVYQNRLARVILPWNLESIGDYAFNGQNNLKSLYIPKSVTSLGRECVPSGTTIICHKQSAAANWARANGRKPRYLEDMLASGEGVYWLPDGIKKIEYGAFEGTPEQCVVLPDGATVSSVDGLDLLRSDVIIICKNRDAAYVTKEWNSCYMNVAFKSDMN